MLPAVSQRSIIHTGDITVRVPDVNQKAAQAEALAAGAGGYVGGDDRQIDAGQSTATLTLRVSADRFDATLNAIALLGKEQSRNVSTQDVTSQVIDIAARLTHAAGERRPDPSVARESHHHRRNRVDRKRADAA